MDDMDEKAGSTFELWPARHLAKYCKENGSPADRDSTALIVLNCPLEDFEYFRRLYEHSSFVLYADGGANRVYNLVTSHHNDLAWDTALSKFLPSLIHGDLDSLTSHIRSCYSKLGVSITEDPDQYSTDFGKGIKQILLHKPNTKNILILGSISGRVDQGIGLLHELYREQTFRHPDVKFWFFSESSVSVVLRAGRTVLRMEMEEGLLGRNVGILPVYGKAVVSTRGLEWDVEAWETEMGGQMSTSNYVLGDVVEVETDREVLFTVERGGGG